MRCVSAAAVLVLAACGTPAPTTVGPQRHFEVSFSVRYEAVREVDIVFALDSAEQGREHFTRVLDALGPFVDPPCISRTTPGGGPAVPCDANNPDHVRRFPPIGSLRVGFVSADLGAPGSGIPACETDRGANALLSRTPESLTSSRSTTIPAASRLASRDCEPIPKFLEFCGDLSHCDDAPESPLDLRGARTFMARARCAAAAVGATGCPYSQPLEALWRALVEHGAADPEGSGAPNAGFLRRDALLALVAVSTGEDHSVRDCAHDSGFSNAIGADCTDGRAALRLRPGESPAEADQRFYRAITTRDDPTWNLDRYVSASASPRWTRGFDSLKPGHPYRVAFIAIAGAPRGVHREQYDALLGPATVRDEFASRDLTRAIAGDAPDGGGPFSMRNEPDPNCPHVIPACRREGVAFDPARRCSGDSSVALPSRRLIEVVRRFEQSPRCFGHPCQNRGALVSICQSDFTPAFRALEAIVWARGEERCLARGVLVRRGEDGLDRADCVIRAVLPSGQQCDPTRAQTRVARDAQWLLGEEGAGREVCEITQAPAQTVELPLRTTTPVGEGWYYDRSLDRRDPTCRHRLSYTRRATIRTGTTLVVHCAQQLDDATASSR